MKNNEWRKHVRGESLFIDDLKMPDNLLYGTVYTSSVAKGRIKKIDYSKAEEIPGIIKILTSDDIPGENQIGTIIKDEELFTVKKVKFAGEPILLILSDSREAGKRALEFIEVDIEESTPVTDPRVAYESGDLIVPPRIFSMGNIDESWSKCDYIVEGRSESGPQEHLYMEPQSSVALPIEGTGVKVFSSTQSPTAVQRAISTVLGISMNHVEVDVRRLGGAFGGKEDQATPWAVMAALGAYITNRPVKIILERGEDIRITGKRHPFSADFKIGLKKDGTIIAYEATLYQNCGASADLSTAIMERALFHTTNSYFIPNVKVTGISAYTNLPPYTAFRGFGAPQGAFVIEAAIYKASIETGINIINIREKNLLKESDMLPYGMKVENCNIGNIWKKCKKDFNIKKRIEEITTFNEENLLKKRGADLLPVTFGISFTNAMLNQAGALVHIYTDGSISVNTGAIEMGQGVNQKIRSVAAKIFSVNEERIKVESTNTSRVANTSPTAASTGADLNGKATEIACMNLKERLIMVAAEALGTDIKDIIFEDEKIKDEKSLKDLSWDKLIELTYIGRKNLSSQAFYATPNIWFDRSKEKGKPFAYHVYGVVYVESEVDILRGVYEIKKVFIVHDSGKSLNEMIDIGQIEGAFIQGMGWMTMEELITDNRGILLTATSSSYKVPDIKSIPEEINVKIFENSDNPYAVMGSKAVGEPPFLYGIATYFSIMSAINSYKYKKETIYETPLTPERVLNLLMNYSE